MEEIATAHAGVGAGGEVAAELGGDLLVGCALGEFGVVVKLAEWAEGRVLVGEPEKHQLFEDGFAVGQAVGRAAEPLVDGGLVSIDGNVGEFLDKHAQELVDVVFADAFGKPVEGGLCDLRVAGAAILSDDKVADFVDEAHGEESAGVNGIEAGSGANLGHAKGEFAAGAEVGEDDVADKIEESVADLVAVAGLTRNMEFHHLLS